MIDGCHFTSRTMPGGGEGAYCLTHGMFHDSTGLPLPSIPVGMVTWHDGKCLIKTDHGWHELVGGVLPKAEFPALYAVLAQLPRRNRRQRLWDWLRRYTPVRQCIFGETEDEFKLPDFQGRSL